MYILRIQIKENKQNIKCYLVNQIYDILSSCKSSDVSTVTASLEDLSRKSEEDLPKNPESVYTRKIAVIILKFE